MSLKLPEVCFSTLPTTGELILLKRGERGYYRTDLNCEDREQNQMIAEENNRKLGVNKPQRLAMECGSMFGWKVPGADPQTYLDTMEFFPTWVDRGQLKHPILSIGYPFQGHLFQNITAGEVISYIGLDRVSEHLMGEGSDVVMLPDLVKGKPMLPVRVIFENEFVKNLAIEEGASTREQEKVGEYSIIARVHVGRAELALGESAKSPSRFGTWKRIPENEEGGQHEFFWGHYLNDRDTALKDFEDRVREEKVYQGLTVQQNPKRNGKAR